MIYAGLDVDTGTDYNRNAWIVPGGGAGLELQADGSLRSVQLRQGRVEPIGNPASYHRPMSAATFRPPFEVSGEILLHSRLDNPIIFGTGLKPHWNWVPNFHPAFVDEDNNIVTGCNPGVGWSASGQIDKKYGIARDYLYVKRPDTLQFGRWYRWRVSVPAVGHHAVFINDERVYEVIERQPPAPWWNRPIHVALRLDYYDYSLRNLNPGDDAVSQPFDHSRFDWYPTLVHDGVLFRPGTVLSSTGAPRPKLSIPLSTFTVHYGGAGQWLDPGDTAGELAAIETYHAIPQKKPNEYNSASDSEGVTWEWAGRYRAAHSGGENSSAWGHLCVLGLETPTESQADRLIAGIRKARQQAVDAGYLTANHQVVAHRNMPGAATGCPGPLYTNGAWWARIAAPLTSSPPTPPWEINDMELIYTPPAGSPANTPWLYQKDGSITYCTSAAHADATGRGVSVVALNAEQYPYARKAAGL